MTEIDDAVARLQGISARQAEAHRSLTTEVARHRTRLTNVETTQASQQQIVAGLQSQVADHEGRFDTIDGAVVAMTATLTGFEATTDMLRVAHEQNAQRIDTNDMHIATHTQQIDTHDTWFVALFEHIGPRIMWAWIAVVCSGFGVFAGIYSYFWIFEKYGLDKHFNVKGVDVLVTGEPTKCMLASAAVGLALACLLAVFLSFILIRPHSDNPPAAAQDNANAGNQNNAGQGNNDPITAPGAPPAPVGGGVPAPPPPPAPAPTPAPQPQPMA